MELLTRSWDLSRRLRVPAISRLQKMHNVGLALELLRSRGVRLDDEHGEGRARPAPRPGTGPALPRRAGGLSLSVCRQRHPGQGHRGQAQRKNPRAAVEDGARLPGTVRLVPVGIWSQFAQ